MNTTQGVSLADKLAKWSQREGDCLIWQRARLPWGYGKLAFKGKLLYAHRAAYIAHVGPIPKGMQVLHHCDNPPCIEPTHLFLGTNADNRQDSVMKGRHCQGERQVAAILTIEKVHEIRRMYASGRYFQRELGEIFGVTQTLIGGVVRGSRWTHVR
jgi:hypothetical protein